MKVKDLYDIKTRLKGFQAEAFSDCQAKDYLLVLIEHYESTLDENKLKNAFARFMQICPKESEEAPPHLLNHICKPLMKVLKYPRAPSSREPEITQQLLSIVFTLEKNHRSWYELAADSSSSIINLLTAMKAANIDYSDQQIDILALATRSDWVNIVEFILKDMPSLSPENIKLSLYQAIHYKYPAIIAMITEKVLQHPEGAAFIKGITFDEGKKLIHFAAHEGWAEVVTLVVRHQLFDIDAPCGPFQRTPLMLASETIHYRWNGESTITINIPEKQQHDVIAALLNGGANPNLIDKKIKQTPVSLAKHYKRASVIALFVGKPSPGMTTAAIAMEAAFELASPTTSSSSLNTLGFFEQPGSIKQAVAGRKKYPLVNNASNNNSVNT